MQDFDIIEVDRDYHTVTDRFKKKFNSLEEAEAWAKKESWTGYDYFVSKRK